MLMAALEWDGVQRPVKLSDLSTLGALVIGHDLPPKGSAVVFYRNSLVQRSRMAWVHRQQGGIEFETAIDAADVLRNVPPPTVREINTEDYRRPGFKAERLTDRERIILDEWGAKRGLGPIA
jgi:hypothetical protein